jgi:cobalamin biosynthesis Co2+ chelatase CbiK
MIYLKNALTCSEQKRVLKRKNSIVILMVVLMLAVSLPMMGSEKTGLVVVAHGSAKKTWNNNVLNIEGDIKAALVKRGSNPFSAIRVALMEISEPTIAGAIKDLEDAGIKRVYVLPLFIAPSGHSRFDIPSILCLYSDKKKMDELKEEGIEVVNSKMKITIGPELNYGNVLREIMLDRVKELSVNPEEEGVVLLSHGAKGFETFWDSMSREIGVYIAARTSIRRFDYALVEVGQSFMTNGISAILRISEKSKKIIVVGLYVGMSVERMAKRSSLNTGMMSLHGKEILSRLNIQFAKKGLLPDRRITEWIVDRALEWAEHNRDN